MKISKLLQWMIPLVILAASLVAFFSQTDAVQATFTDFHTALVLVRVEREILQKSPAGQYYESLFWKHNEEIVEITRKYPDHNIEFSNVTRLFVPGLEALLDGKGSTVYITADQIKSFEGELAWFASMGSPALQDDIQKELQRFPLDQFIGMSMSEAQDFVNSHWVPDSVMEKSLVPDSDGKWAYFILNDVYFEYPGSYKVQVSESNTNHIYLIPSTDLPENWDSCVVKISVFKVSPDDKDDHNPRLWYSPEDIVWQTDIWNDKFYGNEFASGRTDYPVSSLHSFQYNKENQLAAHIWVFLNENLRGSSLDYSDWISQRYGYFQHLVMSLRVQP